MAALWIFAGAIWLIYNLIKDSSTKQVPPGQDFSQAQRDYYSGKCSKKEMEKRLYNGYYKKR